MTIEKNLLFSVVIPVYNSEDCVNMVIERTHAAFAEWGLKHEIILVNDGSKDNSWDVISSAASKSNNVTAINLLKNYGQHNAMLCGFEHSKGDYVITIDDDLQNPPEEIIKLINKAMEGYDLVMGDFHTKKHAGYRRWGSRVVWKLNQKIFEFDKNLVLSNFRLVHRDVVQRSLDYKTCFPYIPGLILMFSSKQANVPVEHHEREHGSSNYTIFRIATLVSRILFNYSSYPLRLVAMFGGIIALGSFLIAAFYLLNGFINDTNVPGWTTLAVLLSFFNGLLLLMLSMIGEYLVRLVNQVSSPKSYYIKDKTE